MSFLTQSHQVFFGRLLCLIPSTSRVIQRLTQSLSSFHSTCPDHLNLLFLMIRLTGFNPMSSPSSSLFFHSFSLTPHIHLIILISVRFTFNSCSTFTGQKKTHVRYISLWVVNASTWMRDESRSRLCVGIVCTDQVELFRKEERVYQPYRTDVRHHRPLPTAGRLLRL